MKTLSLSQIEALKYLYDRPHDYIASKDVSINHPVHITGRILSSLEYIKFVESKMDHKLRVWRITSIGTDYIQHNLSKTDPDLDPQPSDPDAIISVVPPSTERVFFIVTDAQIAHIVSSRINELIPNDTITLHNTIAELNAIIIDYRRMYTDVVIQRDDLSRRLDRVNQKLYEFGKMIQED